VAMLINGPVMAAEEVKRLKWGNCQARGSAESCVSLNGGPHLR
jgi:hypothetical protein